MPGEQPCTHVWYCPEHGLPLGAGETMLTCPNGHGYAVVRGIPRFQSETAYVEHFGEQWNTYVRTQLDSYTGVPISRNRLRRVLGEDLWNSLAGKDVLECGCGAGRFTEVLLAKGASLTSVDLSSAVDANGRLFPVGERHRIAQADILALPFAERAFDVVLCIGVIQHTPSPEMTIAELYRFVKPGGTLAIDHYAPSWKRYTTTAPLVRQILKRLPAKTALRATEQLVDVFLPWHKRFAKSRPLNAALTRISPIRCYYAEYPELTDELQREFALLDTHDSLTDWYKHVRDEKSIRATLERLGVQGLWVAPGGNGVEARAQRPMLA
jgi:2-polyprenyl-3-methyl-5-hydroxy-6-metoxy-1,4-benzoquinol methylase